MARARTSESESRFMDSVAFGARVEQGVCVIYEAEEDGHGVFQVEERGAMLVSGHPRFLSPGVRMAPLYRQSTQHSSRHRAPTARDGHVLDVRLDELETRLDRAKAESGLSGGGY
jgi:hypothetical protein